VGSLVALAVAGYVGSVVGPHFTSSSAFPTTSTSAPLVSTTTSTVPHASVKVLVANGTQEPNAAGHFAQLLQQQGWNVATPGNSTSAASSTTIYYAPSQQPAATLIASELQVPATGVQPLGATAPVGNATGLDVIVVIGPDLAGTGFAATTTPTT
jgi:hypothetical protein